MKQADWWAVGAKCNRLQNKNFLTEKWYYTRFIIATLSVKSSLPLLASREKMPKEICFSK
jgi:hypothetical protein